jgi:hypothetical protein
MKRCYVAVLFLCLSATSVSAQSQSAWGTAIESALVVGSFQFQALDGAAISRVPGTGDRYLTAAGSLVASFTLPRGALITGVEVQGCNSGFPSGNYFLYRTATNIPMLLIMTGSIPYLSGCSFFRSASPPHTVDATTGPYLLMWTPGAADSSQVLTAMRVYYKLQISPDPATATFADVPVGHPFHRFVEALVAAGITGGCGGGNYCPDAPVTRGQMAVFLSAALGLHWAP